MLLLLLPCLLFCHRYSSCCFYLCFFIVTQIVLNWTRGLEMSVSTWDILELFRLLHLVQSDLALRAGDFMVPTWWGDADLMLLWVLFSRSRLLLSPQDWQVYSLRVFTNHTFYSSLFSLVTSTLLQRALALSLVILAVTSSWWPLWLWRKLPNWIPLDPTLWSHDSEVSLGSL